MHVTPQCRHLPIAWKVIVDQAHIHDLLTAVINSRLRVQITQVQARHIEGVQSTKPLNPESTPAPGSVPPGTIVARPRAPVGESGRPVDLPGRVGVTRATGGIADKPPPSSVMPRPRTGEGGPQAVVIPGAEPTPTLVELTIYGVASLYERFPPKPAPATPGATPVPGTPPAPGTTPTPAAPPVTPVPPPAPSRP
jgi:hypothetical protein